MGTVSEVSVPLNTCNKVFVQRDYSQGLGVQFEVTYPAGLEGKVLLVLWHYTLTFMEVTLKLLLTLCYLNDT